MISTNKRDDEKIGQGKKELMQKLIIADCDEYDESVLLIDDMATCFGETKRKSWIDMYTSMYHTEESSTNNSDTHVESSFSDIFRVVLRNNNALDIMKKECEYAIEVQRVLNNRDVEVPNTRSEYYNTSKPKSNYIQELHQLMEQQKREHRALIIGYCRRANVSRAVGLQSQNSHSDDSIRQNSLKYGANDEMDKCPEESFTIHVGAQLKTMHNLRLLSYRDERELYHRSNTIDESTRLQMSYAIYGGAGLTAILRLDNRNIKCTNDDEDMTSALAHCCIQSTEFHFERFDIQIKTAISLASQRKSRKQLNQLEHVEPANILSSGDIYITRHSNLTNVQLVFHMIIDASLRVDDISGRHECIYGLRNVFILSARHGVNTIIIPLLLVDRISEEMTVPWCLKRAELVFKCCKGFLMEICSVSSSDVSRNSQYHLNVEFTLPDDIAADLYADIAEMLSSIFHLVGAVHASDYDNNY